MSDLPMLPPPHDAKTARLPFRLPIKGNQRLWMIGGAAVVVLVLIVIVAIAVTRINGGKGNPAAGVAQTFAAPKSATNGKIDLTANAAMINLHPLDIGNPNLLQGSFTPGKDRGDAVLQHKGDIWALREENGTSEPEDSASWDVGMASGVALDLSVAADASSSDINLTGLTLAKLSAGANAGTMRLVLPTTFNGDVKGTITAKAGTVQITVPSGAAVRIVVKTRAGSRDISSRFMQKNGGYETPEYASAKNRLTLTITADAGRVAVL